MHIIMSSKYNFRVVYNQMKTVYFLKLQSNENIFYFIKFDQLILFFLIGKTHS
jgi:hypothetical protein